MDEILPYHF